jgi:hypothetical protein
VDVHSFLQHCSNYATLLLFVLLCGKSVAPKDSKETIKDNPLGIGVRIPGFLTREPLIPNKGFTEYRAIPGFKMLEDSVMTERRIWIWLGERREEVRDQL